MKHSLESSSGAMESLPRYRHQISADPTNYHQQKKKHNYNNIGTYTCTHTCTSTCSATQHIHVFNER